MAKKISGITIAINGDTSGLAKSLDEVTTQSVKLSKNLKTVDNLLKLDPTNTELVAQKQKILAESIETTEKKLKALEAAQDGVKAQFERGEIGTSQYIAFQEELVRTKKRLESLQKSAAETGDDMKKLGTDTKQAGNDLQKTDKKASELSSTLKTSLAGAAKIAAGAVAGIAAAAAGGIAALNGIAESTEEYRVAMGKLNTAYESAGMSAEAAQTAYTEFYKILGDTDTATEASQLLARLTTNEKDLTKWTKVAAGVAGTFGDALPIEGLIESANETAKVGAITGSLADALNWVGISEDDFNKKLSAMSSEAERNAYIMETLTTQYDSASAAFYKNNDALVKQRENQAALDGSLSQVGESVTNVKNTITSDFLPAIRQIAGGIANVLNGGDFSGIIKGVQTAISKITEYVPTIMQVGVSIIGTIGQSLLDNAPQLITSALGIITTLAQGLADNAATATPKIIELVYSIVEILTRPDTLGALITAALGIITAIAEGLVSSAPLVYEKLPIIIQNLCQTIATCYPQLIMAAYNIIYTLAGGLIQNLPQMVGAGVQMIGSVVQGIVSMFGNLVLNGAQVVDKFGSGIMSMIGKAATWGKDLIDNFIGGIRQKWADLTATVSSVAQTVRDYIGFSEPDKGPLSNFHTYAPDMIDLFTQGIDQNAYKIRDQFTKSLSGLNVAANLTGAGLAKSAAPAVSSSPTQLNLNVNVGSIASDYDVQRMTDTMMEQISGGLERLKMRQNAAVGGAW